MNAVAFTTDQVAQDPELCSFIGVKEDVLLAAARGEVDLNYLARLEIALRGLDKHGNWIGFPAARQAHNIR